MQGSNKLGIKPQPKEKPWRSKKYLAFVRAHDCVDCGWPSRLGNIEAHHIITGGMATKCPDNLAISLCGSNARGCHLKADKNPASADKYRPLAERLHQEWESR